MNKEVSIDFSKLDSIDPKVLADLREAVISKIKEHGIEWKNSRCFPQFKVWSNDRDDEEVEDVMDDLDTLVAIERVLGIGKTKH